MNMMGEKLTQVSCNLYVEQICFYRKKYHYPTMIQELLSPYFWIDPGVSLSYGTICSGLTSV